MPIHPEVLTGLPAVLADATTTDLITLTEVLDALLKRAQTEEDHRSTHALHLAVVNVVELRGRLRLVLAYELGLEPRVLLDPTTSAAPPLDLRHGAVEPGPAPTPFVAGRQSAPGTTGGAAESPSWSSLDALRCAHYWGDGAQCVCDAGHAGDHRRRARTPSREALTAESSGQREPKAAEGAREAGRAEQGRVDLRSHLAAVKAEGGSR